MRLRALLSSRFRIGLVLFLVVLAVTPIGILIHYSAGTRIIRSGRYGLFQIGEDQPSALAQIEQMGIKYVEPLPYESIWIENPSEQQIARFDPYDGIAVLVGEPYGSALHIEFANGAVSKTWPEMKETGYEPASVQEEIHILSELQHRMNAGLARQEVTRDLLILGRSHPIYVSNFVSGEDEDMTINSRKRHRLPSGAWKFDGLKSEVWYNPYYSQVKLVFNNGKLERIEHFVFPFEMP